MGIKKGALEYRKWKKGKRLTRKEAILAFCFDCNGEHITDGLNSVNCKGEGSCPL